MWAFELSGRTVRVRDSKGIRHLAELLSQPGVEVHALDLVRVGDAAAPARPRRCAGCRSTPAPARVRRSTAPPRRRTAGGSRTCARSSRRRRWRDPERASRAREEIDFIAAELSAAVGLGGRDRPQASDAERARVNVTRAIKTAVRRLGAQDAELGAELEATVHTGLFCRHEPDPRRPVHWEVRVG